MARTRRIAIAHVAAAGVVGLFGAGAALSAVWLTAAVLTALAGAGVMVAIAARQIPMRLYAWLVGDWAAGAAALALPGAAVTAVLADVRPRRRPAGHRGGDRARAWRSASSPWPARSPTRRCSRWPAARSACR